MTSEAKSAILKLTMPVEMCGDYLCDFASSGKCALADEVRSQLRDHKRRLTDGDPRDQVERSWKGYRKNAADTKPDCQSPDDLQRALDDTVSLP